MVKPIPPTPPEPGWLFRTLLAAACVGGAVLGGAAILATAAEGTPWSVPDGEGGWTPNPECHSSKCHETGDPDKPITEPKPPTPPDSDPPPVDPEPTPDHPPETPGPFPDHPPGGCQVAGACDPGDDGGHDPGPLPPDSLPPPRGDSGGGKHPLVEQHYSFCCLSEGVRYFGTALFRDPEKARQQCGAKVAVRECPFKPQISLPE